ncbi:MAG: allantoinase, partial [Brevibacterium sp.]|nr:allantoinase [Brevibacterium sp.]
MNVDDAGTPATDQEFDLVIRAQRAVLPGGQSAAEVGVRGGRIVEIATGDTVLSGTTSANAKVVELDASQVLLPG